MKAFWNERFSMEEYVYGEEPNTYLVEQLAHLGTGKILFPADGEGRNSVYAASLGWASYAFDQSEVGQKKAIQLAAKKAVSIDYQVANMEEIEYPQSYFDALVLIFAHFPEADRTSYHQKLASFLKPGGVLIIQGFSKKHPKFQEKYPNIGGPRDISLLYDVDEIKNDFKGFEFIEADEQEIQLSEGAHHHGVCTVVNILARKK